MGSTEVQPKTRNKQPVIMSEISSPLSTEVSVWKPVCSNEGERCTCLF